MSFEFTTRLRGVGSETRKSAGRKETFRWQLVCQSRSFGVAERDQVSLVPPNLNIHPCDGYLNLNAPAKLELTT